VTDGVGTVPNLVLLIFELKTTAFRTRVLFPSSGEDCTTRLVLCCASQSWTQGT